ncbi:putative threonine protease PRSS50 isoform 1-T1 [Sarcophilus harrisii]
MLGALLMLLVGYTVQDPPTPEDASGCGRSYLLDRVIAGDDAMARKWPWQVSIQQGKEHRCGGSLIAPKWVLTAANCVKKNDTLNVLLGTTILTEETNYSARVLVQEVVIHPNYQQNRYWSWIGRENNLALLKLSDKVNYTKQMSPVCIASSAIDLRVGSFCWITGWGQTKVGDPDESVPLSPILQEAEISIMHNDDCDTLYHDVSEVPSIVRIISSSMLCSDYSRGRDFCYGDDGSPLVCEIDHTWFQVGVVSWTLGCAHLETPGVYSRISEYSKWIEREIAELNSATAILRVSSGIVPSLLLGPLCVVMAL